MSDADARRLPDAWGTLPVFRRQREPMLASLALWRWLAVRQCDDDLFQATERGFRERF